MDSDVLCFSLAWCGGDSFFSSVIIGKWLTIHWIEAAFLFLSTSLCYHHWLHSFGNEVTSSGAMTMVTKTLWVKHSTVTFSQWRLSSLALKSFSLVIHCCYISCCCRDTSAGLASLPLCVFAHSLGNKPPLKVRMEWLYREEQLPWSVTHTVLITDKGREASSLTRSSLCVM